MTALYFPPNVTAGDVIPRLLKKGVVIAGGLHADIKGHHSIFLEYSELTTKIFLFKKKQINTLGLATWAYRL
jgi:hypothetical protein